jgi:hypothetical protein
MFFRVGINSRFAVLDSPEDEVKSVELRSHAGDSCAAPDVKSKSQGHAMVAIGWRKDDSGNLTILLQNSWMDKQLFTVDLPCLALRGAVLSWIVKEDVTFAEDVLVYDWPSVFVHGFGGPDMSIDDEFVRV